jgi:D-alanine-D-alanine ligase
MRDSDDTPGVVVLYNHSEDLIKGDPRDILADQGVIACAHAVAQALMESGARVALAPIRADVETALKPYPATDWIVFNLGEGLGGRLFEEVRIAWAIETMGYRFTGADAAALALSTHKARAKEALARAGVATPAWRLFRHPDEVTPECLADFPLPLIVKPVAEDASQGIAGGAVVRTLDELRARVAYLVQSYRQAALTEEFIEGREFNISVWGNPPTTLPIAEIDFSAFHDPLDRIVSFAAKWEEESFEYSHTPVVCPAQVTQHLAKAIRQAALKAWQAIGGQGYGRVDMRVSRDNIPYVIEINCNPDISPDAGFFRAARTAGYTYRDMAVKILQMALGQKRTYDSNR